MTVSEPAALDSIVANVLDEYRERLKRGERPTVEEYTDRHPEAADLLRNVLATIELLDLSLSGAGDNSGDAPAGNLGDFRLIREVGRGGMGIVYEAEQISLNRRVALKVLPFAATMDPRQLLRFQNEAKAAACLRHENIVHVYGVGCERGVHFYAMEFIEGQTLAGVIAGRASQRERDVDEAHVALTPRRSPTTVAALSTKKDKSHFRRLAEIIERTADALEHAHSMGIVHRDVKPGNLLLDHTGKVYVSDFGLARFGPDAGMTLTGDLVGTLRYMSPEQALARHGLVDHRTDVYSLGATLYELLTLRPAVSGEDKGEILKAIAWDEPTPLRKHDKSIPAELETITLKCLAKEPSGRYATAGELAEDLRRWLGDHAIKAKPPGWREKAAKWVRRHQTFTRMSFVILVLAVTGLAVSTWLIWREKEAVRLAKIDVETQRDRAAKARDRTFEALDAMTSGLAGASLEVESTISSEQKTFLTNVLDYYQEFAAEQGEDEQTRKRIAAAAARVALIHSRLGARKASFKAVEQARDAYLKLAADFPAVPEYRHALAQNLGAMALMLAEFGKYSDAEAGHHQALTILNQLAAEFPTDPQFRLAIATTHDRLGLLFREVGKWKEAGTTYREGLAIRKTLAAEFPFEPLHRSYLAHSHNNLGNLLRRLGKRQEAETAYKQAVALQEKLVADFPTKHAYRSGLATHHSNLGNHKQALEILDKLVADFPAVPDYRKELAKQHSNVGNHKQALEILDKLVADFSAEPEYRHELGIVHGKLGQHLLKLGNEADAESSYRRALALYEKVTSDYPTVLRYRSSLARGHSNLGTALRGLERAQEAEASARNAIALHESLVAEYPGLPEYRHALGQSQVNLGASFRDQGNRSAAETLSRQAIALLETLVAEFPGVPEYRLDLAKGINGLGILLKELSNQPEAEEAHRRALAHREKLVADFPSRSDFRENLAASYHNLALLFNDSGRLLDAETAFREAIALEEKLAADFPDVPAHRHNLAKRHNKLGAVLHNSGKRPQAEAAFRQSLAFQVKLAADFPNVPQHQIDLAGTQVNLGHMLRQKSHEIESIEFYDRSIALLKPLVDANPRLTTARQYLRNAHDGRARSRDRLERFVEAIQDWERTIELSLQDKQPGLAADFPAVAEYRRSLAKSHTDLGILLNKSGKRTEEATAFRNALAIHEKLAADFPAVPEYQIELAGSQVNLGHLLRESGKQVEALELYDRAIATLKPLVEAQSHVVNGRQYLLYAHWGRADVLDRLERFADAIQDWDRAIVLSPPGEQLQHRLSRASSQIKAGMASEAIAGVAELSKSRTLSVDQLYDFACVYAVASNKIVDKKQEYADRAMALLQKAREAGYKNAAHMKKDTDLDALREREDFKKLLAELEAKVKQ